MLDGTGDPLVHLTTPIYTNVVKGKFKKGIERRPIGKRMKLKMLLARPIYFSQHFWCQIIEVIVFQDYQNIKK